MGVDAEYTDKVVAQATKLLAARVLVDGALPNRTEAYAAVDAVLAAYERTVKETIRRAKEQQ